VRGREDIPQRVDRQERCRNLRPQARDQQRPETDRQRLKEASHERRSGEKRPDSLNDDRTTGSQPQQQKPDAGGAVGEC